MTFEVVSLKPNEAFLREYEDRAPNGGEIKVTVDYASPKHGTEFNLFRGTDPFLSNVFDEEYNLFMPDCSTKPEPFFMRPGNMFVGRVTELGEGVTKIALGQRVAGIGPIRNTQILPESKAWIMPDSMTWKEAVCLNPAQFALGGVRDSQLRMGDSAAVFGLGAIGLLAAQMAKKSGASFVAVIDPIERRRAVALECGADAALDPEGCDVGLELKKMTGKRGVDVAIETSGFYPALQQAIRGVAYAGNVAAVGWYKECSGGLHFGLEAHFNQPNLIFSRACSDPNRMLGWSFERITNACWQMLSGGMFDCEGIVDPVVSFKDAAAAYMEINRSPEKSIKLGVDFSM